MVAWLMRYVALLPLKWPRTVLIVSILLTCVASYYIPRLYISTDRNLLAGKNDPSYKRREEVNRMFGTTLVAAVVIQGKDNIKTVQKAADELAAALEKHGDKVRDVFHKADIGFFERHAMLFMTPDKLRGFRTSLESGQVGLETVEQGTDIAHLISAAAGKLDSLTLPENADPKDTDAALDFFERLIDDMVAWLQGSDPNEFDLVSRIWTSGPAMAGSAQSEGYLMERDGKPPHLAVLFVQPADTSQAMEVVAPFTDLLRSESRRVLAKYDGFTSYVTGMPALTTDEMRVVTEDVFVSGIIAGLGVLIIFSLTFLSLRIMIFAVLPLAIGLLWATGLAAGLYGHLTMISGYFASQLFGLGIGYTIYIVSRFHEALLVGEDRRQACETAIVKAGPGVVGSAAANAVAFFAVAVSEFQGFSELGVIAGMGAVFLLTTNLVVLPASMLLWHPGISLVRQSAQGAFWNSIGVAPRLVPALGIAIAIAGACLIPRIGFDYAVENLLPGSAESVVGLRMLNDRTDFTTNYSIVVTDSFKQAEAKRQELAKLSTVVRAESLAMFIPEDQAEKIAILRGIGQNERDQLARALATIEARNRQPKATSTADGAAALQDLADMVQDLSFDAKKAGRREAPKLAELSAKIRKARDAVKNLPDPSRFARLEDTIFTALGRALRVVGSALEEKGVTEKDLPEAIKRRYVSMDDKHYAVLVFPNGDIGRRDFFEKHVGEILSVDAQATGHPVTHLAFTHLIHKGFTHASILAALAVFVLILLDLRRPREFGMAVLPLLVGGGWTALCLGLFDMKLNYANLMGIPVIIGTGVDFGINLAHRARQERSVPTAVRTTGKAIVVSAATMLVGFGSLLVGKHWGVQSLGILLVLGVTFCCIAALFALPALFRDKKAEK